MKSDFIKVYISRFERKGVYTVSFRNPFTEKNTTKSLGVVIGLDETRAYSLKSDLESLLNGSAATDVTDVKAIEIFDSLKLIDYDKLDKSVKIIDTVKKRLLSLVDLDELEFLRDELFALQELAEARLIVELNRGE